MSRGTWPLLEDNACNWQHFFISAAIWFSTGLQETQSTISCSPSIIVIVHSNLGPGRLFYRRIGWQRLKWLLPGSPQVAKAGRRRKRCAMAWRTGEGAARQRMALESLSSSSPFWKITILVFDVSDFHSFSLTRGKYRTSGRIESFRMKIPIEPKGLFVDPPLNHHTKVT